MFANLNGGWIFSNLEAYLQIPGEEKCAELLTINTYRGLGWVGWVLRHANPSGYFKPKTFLFIIFIRYNLNNSVYHKYAV